MKYGFSSRALTRLVCLLIVLLFSVPMYVSAQGRGQGRGLSKKSAKFVNGHDARDGRFDGRGPRTGWGRGRWYRYDNRYQYRNRRYRGWPGRIR
jgi:hypothetical protein